MEVRQIESSTLYCADCNDVFPLLADNSIDFVVDDPPYVNLKGGCIRNFLGRQKDGYKSLSIGNPWGANFNWVKEAKRITKYAIGCWCAGSSVIETANEFSDWTYIALLTWHKRNAPYSVSRYRPRYTNEYCWLWQKKAGIKWAYLNTSTFDIPVISVTPNTDSERVVKDGKAFHPSQKPVCLLSEIIDGCNVDTIGDFHFGTGTTGVAAVKAGKSFIGVEINKEYFDIGCERIERAYRERKSTFAEIKKFKQESLLECLKPKKSKN
jgi:DNA modification methylase